MSTAKKHAERSRRSYHDKKALVAGFEIKAMRAQKVNAKRKSIFAGFPDLFRRKEA